MLRFVCYNPGVQNRGSSKEQGRDTYVSYDGQQSMVALECHNSDDCVPLMRRIVPVSVRIPIALGQVGEKRWCESLLLG